MQNKYYWNLKQISNLTSCIAFWLSHFESASTYFFGGGSPLYNNVWLLSLREQTCGCKAITPRLRSSIMTEVKVRTSRTDLQARDPLTFNLISRYRSLQLLLGYSIFCLTNYDHMHSIPAMSSQILIILSQQQCQWMIRLWASASESSVPL